MIKTEIIATTLDDLDAIVTGGAHRIELVSALSEGGLTPSYGMCAQFRQSRIPVRAMIRPHSNSFVYSPLDMHVMLDDVAMVRDMGLDGIVVGMLTENGDIDVLNLERILAVSGDLNVTFHRAIDDCNDPVAAVKLLKQYPQIATILTSGGPGIAFDNKETLKQMVLAADDAFEIQAGAGMNESNAQEVATYCGVPAIHFGTAARPEKSMTRSVCSSRVQRLVSATK
ncbi:MAG: copper homeostasis protein CutC [Bacilli bacterium]